MFFNKNSGSNQEHLQHKVTSIEVNNSEVYLTTNGAKAASYIVQRLYGYLYASAVDGGAAIEFNFKLLNENTITLQGSDKMLAIVFSLLKATNLLNQQSIGQLNQQNRYTPCSF